MPGKSNGRQQQQRGPKLQKHYQSDRNERSVSRDDRVSEAVKQIEKKWELTKEFETVQELHWEQLNLNNGKYSAELQREALIIAEKLKRAGLEVEALNFLQPLLSLSSGDLHCGMERDNQYKSYVQLQRELEKKNKGLARKAVDVINSKFNYEQKIVHLIAAHQHHLSEFRGENGYLEDKVVRPLEIIFTNYPFIVFVSIRVQRGLANLLRRTLDNLRKSASTAVTNYLLMKKTEFYLAELETRLGESIREGERKMVAVIKDLKDQVGNGNAGTSATAMESILKNPRPGRSRKYLLEINIEELRKAKSSLFEDPRTFISNWKANNSKLCTTKVATPPKLVWFFRLHIMTLLEHGKTAVQLDRRNKFEVQQRLKIWNDAALEMLDPEDPLLYLIPHVYYEISYFKDGKPEVEDGFLLNETWKHLKDRLPEKHASMVWLAVQKRQVEFRTAKNDFYKWGLVKESRELAKRDVELAKEVFGTAHEVTVNAMITYGCAMSKCLREKATVEKYLYEAASALVSVIGLYYCHSEARNAWKRIEKGFSSKNMKMYRTSLAIDNFRRDGLKHFDQNSSVVQSANKYKLMLEQLAHQTSPLLLKI